MSSVSQKSFASGELTPSLHARVDISKYQTGLRTCRNFVVHRHGGVSNRAGSQFIAEVKDSTKNVRLIPFVFNSTQTYVLEFGDQYMRVHKNGSQVIEAAKTITGITQANPAVVTSASHGYATGEEVYLSGIVGMTQLNGRNLKITVLSANTYSLQYMDGTNVNSTGFTAYSSAGSSYRVYTISTPYLEADLPAIKYIQSGDIVTLTHPSYAVRDLARTGDTSWTLSTVTFEPSIATPTGLSVGNAGTPATTTYSYVVTAIQEDTYEESLASSTATTTTGAATLNGTNYNTLSWTAVTGATQYNVYRVVNGVSAFIGIAGTNAYNDQGQANPDSDNTPPEARNPFSTTNEYPACATYYQQRLMFANQNNNTEAIYGSRTGAFENFTQSQILADDDAVTFSIVGRQVNSVNHLIDLGSLIIFTDSGEWTAQGDNSGVLKPTAINTKQYSYNGSNSNLAPIIIGNTALYVQKNGSIVRDLGFNYQVEGYSGNDLTIFGAHLVDGYTLTDWAYQKTPHSVVWAVRDDGAMLGLTYIKEQDIIGWHRHDFEDGLVENVCSVPEGSEDALYVVVNRTINGREVRYVERMASRLIDDIKDAKFLDSHLSYDGRNTGVKTMTLSGSGWTSNDTLTCTASAATFSASDVGNEVHFYLADSSVIRCEITAYTSSTVVSVRPNRDVPVEIQATATTEWALAVDSVSGLYHLEGKNVSVFADGFVIANPNNDSYTIKTISSGTLTLDRAYAVIHVGLPYTSDFESLDIDTVQGETIADKSKNTGKVTLYVEKTRGLWLGASAPVDEATDFLGGLTEIKARLFEGYDQPVDLSTGKMDVIIRSEWNSNGRIFLRQTDPIPATILALIPSGWYPFRG